MMALAGTCTLVGVIGSPLVMLEKCRGRESRPVGRPPIIDVISRRYQPGRGATTEAPRGGRTAPTGRMNGKGS